MYADCRIEIGIGGSQDGGHGATGGQTRHKYAIGWDFEFCAHLPGEPRDNARFATQARLILRTKPIPAGHHIGCRSLTRIGNQEIMCFGQRIHIGADGKVFPGLPASMQHHDQAAGFDAGRDEQPEVALPAGTGEVAFREVGAFGNTDAGDMRLDIDRRFEGAQSRDRFAESREPF